MMPPKKDKAHTPIAGDDDLWARAMRDTMPLKKDQGHATAAPPPPQRPAPKSPPKPKTVAPPPPRQPVLEPGSAPGLDKRTAERLRRGQIAVEARIDLHGHTQAEAHRALTAFIIGAAEAGRRCVLVITGKGEAGAGVIRAAVPAWLNAPDLRPKILAFRPAQPRDGGTGALYVLLKRKRAG
jgi:DNA-nicking Smr family endonuclease